MPPCTPYTNGVHISNRLEPFLSSRFESEEESRKAMARKAMERGRQRGGHMERGGQSGHQGKLGYSQFINQFINQPNLLINPWVMASLA
jgi:hypothetical protein